MESKEGQIVSQTQESSLVMPSSGSDIMTPEAAQQHWERFRKFVKQNLRPGIDFGSVGQDDKDTKRKPGLFRPGAEKILGFNGMGATLQANPGSVVDWKTPFFHYDYKAAIISRRTGQIICTADGSANSLEDKFRWHWLSEKKLPKTIDKESLVSRERNGQYGPYLQFRLPVDDPYSQVNNIQKRAGKRALVAGVLIACAASDFFSQDEDGEDEAEDGATSASSKNTEKAAGQTAPAGGNTISPGQQKLVYARFKAAGIDETLFKQFLDDGFGVEHTKDIKAANLDEILKWIEENKKA